MARDIGTEYNITENLQTIDIPIGDEGVGQTLINDGAAEIFWREKDVTLSETDIEAASAAVLVATPLFFSRLGPGEFIHKAGITIYAIRDTTTQVDSVLRVAPGRLYQSNDALLVSMLAGVRGTAFGTQPLYLAVDDQSAVNVHTIKGTAEEITGATAFTAGTTVEVTGADAPVWPANSKAQAELNATFIPPQNRCRIILVGTSVWIDSSTGATYTVRQVT